MTARTYVDAAGVMAAWINSRTTTLAGPGFPLQMGAHLKLIGGGEPVTYAYLEEQISARSETAESPDMLAFMSAQIFGGTREAATLAAVALAEELSTWLDGRPVPVASPAAVIQAVDDIQGPSWFPDNGHPRLLLNWSVRIQPA